MSEYIKLEDAINEAKAWSMYGKQDLVSRLEKLPSIDIKTGEWVDRSEGGRIKYPWWESCECNKCGEYGSGAYNYCPNCGAKMNGESNE